MSPQGRKVLELGTPLIPPCIFVCSPPPRSSPFTVIGAGLHSSLTHLCSSLASHRPPLRWFAAVLANPKTEKLCIYSLILERIFLDFQHYSPSRCKRGNDQRFPPDV